MLRGRLVPVLALVIASVAFSGCIDASAYDDMEEGYDSWEETWDSWAAEAEAQYDDWKEQRERERERERQAAQDRDDDGDHEREDPEECPEEEMADDEGSGSSSGSDDDEDSNRDSDADDDDGSGHDDYDDAYSDADNRYSNHIHGHEDTKRTISVPSGTRNLHVDLKYDLDGDVTFRLRDPLGLTQAREDFHGDKQAEEDPWFETKNPLPGDWTLEIEIDGDGAYAVGFYL